MPGEEEVLWSQVRGKPCVPQHDVKNKSPTDITYTKKGSTVKII